MNKWDSCGKNIPGQIELEIPQTCVQVAQEIQQPIENVINMCTGLNDKSTIVENYHHSVMMDDR